MLLEQGVCIPLMTWIYKVDYTNLYNIFFHKSITLKFICGENDPRLVLHILEVTISIFTSIMKITQQH